MSFNAKFSGSKNMGITQQGVESCFTRVWYLSRFMSISCSILALLWRRSERFWPPELDWKCFQILSWPRQLSLENKGYTWLSSTRYPTSHLSRLWDIGITLVYKKKPSIQYVNRLPSKMSSFAKSCYFMLQGGCEAVLTKCSCRSVKTILDWSRVHTLVHLIWTHIFSCYYWIFVIRFVKPHMPHVFPKKYLSYIAPTVSPCPSA